MVTHYGAASKLLEFFNGITGNVPVAEDVLELWNDVDFPAYETSTYADIEDNFVTTRKIGIYDFDLDYITDVLLDYEFDQDTIDGYFGYYDGTALWFYMYVTEPYDFTAGNSSESFGACIGDMCAGWWIDQYEAGADWGAPPLQAAYYAINFYEDSPDESVPDVPYAYDSNYYSADAPFYYFQLGASSTWDENYQNVETYAYRQLHSLLLLGNGNDYAVGDEVTVVAFTSLSPGANEVQTLTLEGESSGAVSVAASCAALAAGVAALF